ncbi:surfactin synthase thioesterase subunit [Thermocatellispora tengchongensis]|uniref:Surfactin synthase thioesterase subunit n=1 Tax=Thermocatellispora tengchongensis TaxID=1073253 RepID=A0A840PQ38_9ACTN|nr:alpha/beta fold hydrolase [Thermocatellispora tengchongensis]MBB5140193.1 surfactin synthase thioesterase subunit [Thermocatellispora tengchongensis]
MSAADPGLWLRRFHAGDGPRLVLFPHAGGSASYFHGLSGLLVPALDVLAVQYPGRQDRRAEPAVQDIRELAGGIAEVLAAEPDAGPYALFGHSMGASVAFEVALRLEREGVQVSRLFASGRPAPGRRRDDLPDGNDDAALLAELRGLSGTDARILDDPDVVEMILPALRADYRAIDAYEWRPGDVLACPVTAMVGDDDPRVAEDDARAWAGYTTGPFELLRFPGGHFYLGERREEVAKIVAARLT